MIEQIGKHRIKHGDVMKGIDDLMQNEKADIFYSDPPWGNLSYWQKLNTKQNNLSSTTEQEIDLDEFLNQIFKLAKKYSKKAIFIEYGIKWEAKIKELGMKYGLIHNATVVTKYGSGSKLLPLHLHIFSIGEKLSLTPEYLNSIKDTKGMATLTAAVKPFVTPTGIVLDPCCGMGYSAQVAINNGMIFRGNELNKARLEKTKARLVSNKHKMS